MAEPEEQVHIFLENFQGLDWGRWLGRGIQHCSFMFLSFSTFLIVLFITSFYLPLKNFIDYISY